MPPLEGVTQKLDKFYRGYLSGMGLQPSSSANSPILNRRTSCFVRANAVALSAFMPT